MASQWGSLTYTAGVPIGVTVSHDLIITGISQTLQLDGSSAQSRRKRHFYPRSHMPGDIVVNGICMSQEEYQRLAYFIRHNQWAVLGTPTGNFQRRDSVYTHRLLLLDIPTEQISYRGFIKTFGMTKKGVFDPAPTYTFNFTPVFRLGESPDGSIGISSRQRQYYSGGTKDPGPIPDPGTGGGGDGGGGDGGGQPGGTYTVAPGGEILRVIAKRLYTHPVWWKAIIKANPGVLTPHDPNQLVPGGTVLNLPPQNGG